MKIADLFFRASLDDSRLEVDAKKSGGKAGAAAAKGFGSKFSNEVKRGIGIGAGFTAFNVLGNAIHRVTSFLGDAAQAYREDQSSQAKLRASLEANIEGWDGNAEAIESVLQERIKLGFSDDEQRASLATLVTRTHDYTEALKLQRTAMDLARLRGMDLQSATDLIGKAYSGQIGALRKAGIAVDANATSTEALAAVQKAAAGQAEAFADTEEGRVVVAETRAAEASERLGKSWSDLETRAKELAVGPMEALADAFDSFDNEQRAMADAAEYLRSQGLEPTRDEVLKLYRQFMLADASGLHLADHTLKGHLLGSLDDLDDSLKGVDRRQTAAASSGETLTDVLRDMGYEAGETDEALDDLASTIADELFGDAINAGNEARLKENIADLIEQRKKAKEGSREFTILTGEIAENRQALFELHLEQAKEKGPQAAIDFLQQERRQLNKSDSAAQRYIDDLIALYSLMQRYQDLGVISFGRYAGKIIPRAEGGPVRPEQMYLVGEQGPEMFVPDQAGTIYPDVMRSAADMSGVPTSTNSWASSMDITLNVDARGSTNPAATGTAVRQGVHDAMADVLRQQTARLPSGTRS